MCLFKPGVYWDDAARNRINEGGDPAFKARGVSARDFAGSITEIDAHFSRWPDHYPESRDPDGDREGWFPRISFPVGFSMVTAKQALQRNKWFLAGAVSGRESENPPRVVYTGHNRTTDGGKKNPHPTATMTHPTRKNSGSPMTDTWKTTGTGGCTNEIHVRSRPRLIQQCERNGHSGNPTGSRIRRSTGTRQNRGPVAMKEYRCDYCKKPISNGSVTYELRTIYSPKNQTESHYHWPCLFLYLVADAEESLEGTWTPNPDAGKG
jgi:hypothetical protein